MRHIRQKHGLGIIRNLRSLQRFRKLLVMDFPLCLSLRPDLPLLLLIQEISYAASQERAQHNGHHDKHVLVDRVAFPLYRLDRHISDQIERPLVHPPHIDQRILVLYLMVEHYVLSGPHALVDVILDVLFKDLVSVVEILQIQMPCVTFTDPLRLKHQPLAVCIHNVQLRALIVKFVRQRFIQ